MLSITPVLLAGGSGTRLWPLSRKSYPKQFTTLTDSISLFQQSAVRLARSQVLSFSSPITLTNSDFRFVVGDQLKSVGLEPGTILVEPESKNTAPAILAASMFAVKSSSDAILLVAPSDHIISNVLTFHEAILSGLDAVNQGKIVTFGIKPRYPETGYGYLELSDNDSQSALEVSRFIEKPMASIADEMFNAGNFLWNAGIFLFKAQDMVDAFRIHAEDLIQPVEKSLEFGVMDLDFFRLDPKSWAEVEDISIDYAVMEKSDNLVAIPYHDEWSDLGDWDAVWKASSTDNLGVATSENAYSIDCKDTLLRSENENTKIVGLGLENIVAVAMPDAVLVANKNRAQEVKRVVSDLKALSITQAEKLPKDYRPWGWFESLVLGERFQVKRIFVNPGASLSLQSHHHRSEHWVVVEGTAKVTVNKNEELVSEGESIYIPLGAIHRMENPGKLPMILIEVQTGSYLGEDDIIRYDDVYKRE